MVALLALGVALSVPATSPPTAEAKRCKHADGKPTRLSKSEARGAVRCLINNVRDNNGRSRLSNDSRIARAAYKHTNYMEDHHCFAHQCGGEPSLGSRLRRVDYIKAKHDRYGYSENIGAGTSIATPRRIVQMWMGSSAHRAAILDRRWDEFGVGFVKGTIQNRSGNGGIYTVDFGYTHG
jgi:uncharacterized protein YkwD